MDPDKGCTKELIHHHSKEIKSQMKKDQPHNNKQVEDKDLKLKYMMKISIKGIWDTKTNTKIFKDKMV